MNTHKSSPVMYLVGRRPWWPVLTGHGDKLWHRLRYPFTRRTVLHVQGLYNPKTLAREKKILNKKPIWWALGLVAGQTGQTTNQRDRWLRLQPA